MKPTLKTAQDEISRRIVELSAEQMQRIPHPDAWSRQQVVEHLILAHDATSAELQRRLERGPSSRRRSLRDRIGQFVLITLGHFPSGRLSPEMVDPRRSELPAMDGSGVAAAYRLAVQNLAAEIDRCEKKYGSSKTICTHPVLGPMNAPQWRTFHAIHALHHCDQLDRILAEIEGNPAT